MNIYDFDGTIYDGDSCRDIIKFGLKRHPFLTMRSLKIAKKLNKEYEQGIIPFEKVKEQMLSFIFKIRNYPKFINKFVDKHINKIKPWYLSRKTENDVIVSASYELWLNVFAKRLGIKYVIGTKTNFEGYIVGNNCKSAEKVNRIQAEFPQAQILSCYADSSTDIPILELSSSSYVVEGNTLITYKKGYAFKNNK